MAESLSSRFAAGEEAESIASDYAIDPHVVREAIRYVLSVRGTNCDTIRFNVKGLRLVPLETR